MLKRLLASRKKPYFPTENKFETLTTNLSGTKLSFTCPLPSAPSALPYQKHFTDINIFDHSQYEHLDERCKNLLEHQRGDFPSLIFIKRDWGFWGAISEPEEIGRLSLAVFIHHADSMPESMSCFNPEHFEKAILHNLYYMGGPGSIISMESICPAQWAICNINNRNWVYCEILEKINPHARASCQYYTPIDDKYFIRLCFNLSGFRPYQSSLEVMRSKLSRIMMSPQLNLNPSAELKCLQAKEKWNTASYSKHRDPENWKYYDYDDVLNKYCSYGSPPPEWD